MSENENKLPLTAETLREMFPIKPTETDPRVAFYELGYAAREAEEAATAQPRLQAGPRNWGNAGFALAAAALAFVLGMAVNRGSLEQPTMAKKEPSAVRPTPVEIQTEATTASTPDEPSPQTKGTSGFPSVPSIDFVWNAGPQNFTLTAGGVRLQASSHASSISSRGAAWTTSQVLSGLETDI